jgi:colicin import membrane protein
MTEMTMSNVVVTIEPQTALSIFAGEQTELDSILADIAEKARSIVPDVTTAKGRAAIASNAAKVSSSKVAIEKAGKELADSQKEIPKLIDASRKRSREFLDALRDEVRQPLTEWEAEQARIKAEKEEAERVEAARIEAERQAEQDRIEAQRMFALLWDEAHVMNDRFDVDKEKAEMAKAKQTEQEHKDALAKAEREKLEAEQREKQAVENARFAKENAELLEKQRLIDAENARVAAAEKAVLDKLQAVENERKRVEAEAAQQKAIDDKRAANTRHRTAIKTQVKNSLIDAGLTEEQAKMVVNLAIADKLGALKIQF